MFKKIKSALGFIRSSFKSESGEAITILLILGIIGTLAAGFVARWLEKGGELEGLLSDVANGVIYAVVALLLVLSRLLVQLFGYLAASALAVDIPITTNEAVVMGWKAVRDLANMFIVLGFVVVGIATALRIREYEAQKILIPLIIVALLINFSLFFCGIIIDASNIAIKHFAKAGVMNLDAALGTPTQQMDQLKSNLTATQNAAIGFSMVFFNVAVVIALGILSIFLVARYGFLMLLVVFSPLAFICSVFGATKKYAQMWWNQFLKWSFAGIVAVFCLWLGINILVGTGTSSFGSPLSSPEDIGKALPVFLSSFIIVAGALSALKIGGMGAGTAMSLATGAAGYALGATKGVAKWTGQRVAESRAGQAVQEAGIGMLGTIAPMTAAQMQAKRADDELKRMKNLASMNPDKAAKYAERTSLRGAAAAQALGEAKPELLQKEHYSALVRGKAFGYKTSDVLNKRPDLADNPGDIIGKMSVRQARNIHSSALGKASVVGVLNQQQLRGIIQSGPPASIAALKNLTTTPQGKTDIRTQAQALKTDPATRANLARNVRIIRESGRSTPQRRV